MTRTNPLNVPSSPPRTSAMTMLVDVRKNLDGENEIHWKSKKMNQNCTGATSYQRSKSNKKIIWMKKISPHSFLYRVCSFTLILVVFFALRSVEAVFTPVDRGALKSAVGACLAETNDGSCPIYAVTNSKGVMGDWDVSKITDMNSMFRDASAFNSDISKWVSC